MRLSSRQRMVIGISVLLLILVIAAGIWWWLSNRPAEPPIVGGELPAGTRRLPVATADVQGTLPTVEIPQADLAANLQAVAITFTERFGSYSNQGSLTNFTDLRSLMTPRMQRWADQYQLDLEAGLAARVGYYGLTTKTLSVRVVSFDPTSGQAELLVTIQRQESVGSPDNPRVSTEETRVKLVQAGQGWKVDEIVGQ